MEMTRRRYLATAATGGVGAIAGCDGGGGNSEGTGSLRDDGGAGGHTPGTTSATARPVETSLPLAEERSHLGHSLDTLADKSFYGGVETDGIPSIDDPVFAQAGEVDIEDGDPVFGLVRNGEARAYRQDVLAHHEIVNDVVGGEGVAVTYCPLTGTVQGFERGDVEFGVSGSLVNSNLIMYDRETDSRWPQIGKTASEGPLRGESLREFRLVRTTWGRWRSVHPETTVITEDTGHARVYHADPYGGYNPPSGYHSSDDGYVVGDEQSEPTDLPLDRVITFDAMWFAWAGYYPETTYVA
jgi:hypothetical protein